MSEGRFALLIGATRSDDRSFPQLQAPTRDVEDLAQVLRDPSIGGFTTRTLINENLPTLAVEIEGFFQARRREDLALLYFSGHGVKDEDGRLYFATPQTKVRLLRSTGLAATFVNDVAGASRASRQVFLLDCCYSGAFSPDKVPRATSMLHLDNHFKSQGRVVLTASDSTQYSFESASAAGNAAPRSVFTSKIVEGLTTGAADLDGDGLVALDELYDYVYEAVLADTPQQHPAKWDFGVKGRIVLARSPQSLRPSELPTELQDSLADPRPWVRHGAVLQVLSFLESAEPRRALAARLALLPMLSDDSQKIRQEVAAKLGQEVQERPSGDTIKSNSSLHDYEPAQAPMGQPLEQAHPPAAKQGKETTENFTVPVQEPSTRRIEPNGKKEVVLKASGDEEEEKRLRLNPNTSHAKKLGRRGFGVFGNMLVGIVGSFLGSFLLGQLGVSFGGGILGSFLTATIGSLVLLMIIGLIKRP